MSMDEEAVAARVADDPAFAALEATGAPIVAALVDPPRAVYANPSARAVFGSSLDALSRRLFEGETPGARRMRQLVDSARQSAAPRLERLRFSFADAPQMVTVLCRRLGGETPSAIFVIAALGVRPAPAIKEPEKPALAPAPPAVEPTEDAEATRALRARLTARHGDRDPRFVWRTDAAGRFVDVTQTLAEVVGPAGADVLGREAADVAEDFALGEAWPKALASRKSWSGVEVEWPLDGAGERAPTTLGGLPVFDADRRFAGFQGYGVLHLSRALARLVALPPQKEAEAAPEQDLGGANVVPLRPQNGPARGGDEAHEPSDALTPTERTAFDEIARALGGGAPSPPAGSARDLMERVERAVEETPTASPDGVGALIDLLPVGVLVARGDAALFVNRTLLDYLGYADLASLEADGGLARVFLERPPRGPDSGHPDHAAFGRNRPKTDNVIDSKSLERALGTMTVLARDGEKLDVDAHAQGVDWRGGPATLVTLRRRRDAPASPIPAPPTEAALEAARLEAARFEAERASAAKSEFLARVSHEIRTPLSAILGFAEVMMEERFGPIGCERYKDYLKDVHASGEHVLSLVNDLLDLSKIEAGKMELEFSSVDANAVISESVAIMQPQANQARVIIRVSLAPRLPNVRADARSLKQILLNLLSNAVKFNEPGGQVIVSTALTEAGGVAIRVKDTGIGMSDADIETALEPFGQVATARKAAGTGLGLPLTKALIEANRASFTILSRKNEGTLIEVAFPPPQAQAAE